MSVGLSVTTEAKPADADCEFVRQMISSFNRVRAESDEHKLLAVFAKEPSGRILGGLLGGTYWKWLHIDYLWVDETIRNQGIGSRLLHAAETEAVRRQCKFCHLETHDFQAPGFYRKHGYKVFAKLPDLPPGHIKLFLKKRLTRERT
jgi:ribosomal protein S18 acetylase RimI-like enzyme